MRLRGDVVKIPKPRLTWDEHPQPEFEQLSQNFPIFLAGYEYRIRMSRCCHVCDSTHPPEKRFSIMLPWKRHIPNTLRSLIAVGTLSAIAALAAVKPYTIVFGQEPAPLKEKAEEPKAAPVKESDEKDPVKESDEKVPVKESDEKVPAKESEEKVEKTAVKEGEKAPAKDEGKDPKKDEQKTPKKEDGKDPVKEDDEGGRPNPRKADPKSGDENARPTPRKGDPTVPGKKGDEETSKDPVPGRTRPVTGKEMKEPGEGKRPVRTPGKEVPKVTPTEGKKTLVEGLPEDFMDQQRQAYARLEDKDLSFEEFLQYATIEFGRLRELEKNPALRYQSGKRGRSALNTACGNGDFEPPLDPTNLNDDVNSAEWSGGYGSVLPGGVIDYANFTYALAPGPISASTARHTIVTNNPSLDPNVPIQMTGPNTNTGSSSPSPNAVRIGNAVNGFGAELLSKRFVVTPAEPVIRFWYAVVMENPVGHPALGQPAFEVLVIDDSTGLPIQNVVNLGCSNPLIADMTNPFFQVQGGATPVVYKDWSCAQIDLSQHVGQTVNVQFVTKDCGYGGHWGYAYVDDFCGTCLNSPTGNIAFDPETSTKCGKGHVCFDYTLPTVQNAAGSLTGTAVITLDIYQNGNLLDTLQTSPATLSSGTNVCFPIDPATIPGLNPSLGFDLYAEGVFTLGGSNLTLTVGTLPNGRIPGPNNDYNDPRDCPGPPAVACGCCPGENLLKNGDFEHDGEIHSEYHKAEELTSLVPGTYSVANVEAIGKACSNWKVPKKCKEAFYDNVLLVNGLTNQPAGSTSVIWEQTVVLPSLAGVKESEYRLCFHYLPLPQCCFDIQAKPYVVVNKLPIPSTDSCDEVTDCGHVYSATFKSGSGPVNIQIVLPEEGHGDGNDLLIDNISIVQLGKVPAGLVSFTLLQGAVSGNVYDVTFTAPVGLTTPYTWEWDLYEADPANPTTPANFTWVSPSGPPNAPTGTFVGLDATKLYWVRLRVKSDCHQVTGVYRPSSQIPTRKKLVDKIDDPNPEGGGARQAEESLPAPAERETGPRTPANGRRP